MGKRRGMSQRVAAAMDDGRQEAYRESLDPQIRNASSGTAMELTLDRIELAPNNYRLLEKEGVTRTLFDELRREALEQLDSEHRQTVTDSGYIDQRERGQIDDYEFLDRVEAIAGQRGEVLSKHAQDRVESIIGMARTIAAHSLLQPIVVHPPVDRDGPYVVHYGNRRTLACILLGRHKVAVNVRHASGDPYSEASAALVENITREDLDLSERLRALHELDGLYRDKYGEGLDVHEIRRSFGLGRTMAYRYLNILHAGKDVQDAIFNGEIRSFEAALQSMNSGEEFSGEAAQSQERAGGAQTASDGPAPAKPPRGRGKPAQSVQLGKTANTSKVRRLIVAVLGEEGLATHYPDVDWSDFGSVRKAWEHFLENMEVEE